MRGIEQQRIFTAEVRRTGSDVRPTEGARWLERPGVARIDFFFTDHGPVLNEVNTMPGMTAESQVPRMFAAAGLPYEDLVTRLVDAAV